MSARDLPWPWDYKHTKPDIFISPWALWTELLCLQALSWVIPLSSSYSFYWGFSQSHQVNICWPSVWLLPACAGDSKGRGGKRCWWGKQALHWNNSVFWREKTGLLWWDQHPWSKYTPALSEIIGGIYYPISNKTGLCVSCIESQLPCLCYHGKGKAGAFDLFWGYRKCNGVGNLPPFSNF